MCLMRGRGCGSILVRKLKGVWSSKFVNGQPHAAISNDLLLFDIDALLGEVSLEAGSNFPAGRGIKPL